MFNKLRQYLSTSLFRGRRGTDPVKAYDLWASGYDDQPDNLMLALDEQLYSELIEGVNFKGKIIADIGCGTGRHWKKMLEKQPAMLIGFDVSPGMLAILQQKFPGAHTNVITGNELPGVADASCDLIISTLTIAHIDNIEASLIEWNRVLKPGGDIIITDYHPEALEKGSNRTFRHDDKVIAIKNNIHSLEKIKKITAGLNWQVLKFEEKRVSEEMRHFYEKQQALAVYEKFKGVAIIYGMHLIKQADGTGQY